MGYDLIVSLSVGLVVTWSLGGWMITKGEAPISLTFDQLAEGFATDAQLGQ